MSPPGFQPISALPEISALIDGAERILKDDIGRIKKLLADPAATLPSPLVEFTLQEAKDALELLSFHARQLTRWQKDAITDAERAEVTRLQAIIPEIRPLVQVLGVVLYISHLRIFPHRYCCINISFVLFLAAYFNKPCFVFLHLSNCVNQPCYPIFWISR